MVGMVRKRYEGVGGVRTIRLVGDVRAGQTSVLVESATNKKVMAWDV